MEKIILIGNEPYKIPYDSITAFKVLDLVIEWMEEHRSAHSGEGIHQNDECLIEAPILISDIVDDVLKPEYMGEDRDDDWF